MDFIKKNWEKVLLGAVLIGLLFAVVGLPIKIASEKADMEEMRLRVTEKRVEPIGDVDVSLVENAIARTQKTAFLDLTTSNRVVNPVPWKRSASGQLFRVLTGDEVGVRAILVDSITPLYLIITLDSVLASDSGVRYAIGVEKQAETSRNARRKRQTYTSVGEKNDTFLLREVKGPAEEPTALELELSDTGERVTISPDKPFKRVDGYMTSLTYPPDNRTYNEERVGDNIVIEREPYNIVAITKDEVVLSARSGKKTTLELNSGG